MKIEVLEREKDIRPYKEVKQGEVFSIGVSNPFYMKLDNDTIVRLSDGSTIYNPNIEYCKVWDAKLILTE